MNKLIDTVFFMMMTSQESNVYFNSQTKDVIQVVNGYFSSHLADDQVSENENLAFKIQSNAPKDQLIRGIHHLIPPMKVKTFCDLLKENGQDIDQFVDFIDEFVEVQEEIHSNRNLYFNERLTNLFLQQMAEWSEDTGTDPSIGTSIFYDTGKEFAMRYLQSVNY